MKKCAERGGAVPHQSSYRTGSLPSLNPGTVTPVEQWASLGLDCQVCPVWSTLLDFSNFKTLPLHLQVMKSDRHSEIGWH